jgi:pimeloyl-ACP methyl ester carboxylesterase
MRAMAVRLAHMEHPARGAESGPPLVVAHGLFGSARNFNTLGRRWAASRRVVLLDMRNHGASPWADAMDYAAQAGDLADAVERLAGGRALVLGHSMGGKAAMALALTRPELVAGLIIADIAPVPYAHTHLSYVRAMRAVDLARVRRRSDADPMLADAVPDPTLRAFLLQNLLVEDGAARWRLNLAAIEHEMPKLTGWPADWPRDRFEGPTHFLHGGASDYVPDAGRAKIAGLFPAAEVEAIDGAGHWLHAEKPAEFAAAVERWLARQ